MNPKSMLKPEMLIPRFGDLLIEKGLDHPWGARILSEETGKNKSQG